MGYKEDLELDFYRLHENWRMQPGLYMKWSQKWADAVEALDKRKQFLDIDIRDNWGDYGFSKGPSESGIAAKISADSEVIQLSKDVNVLKSAKAALEHRRASLEGLTKLYQTSYFSSNDLPVELDSIMKGERGQRVAESQQKKLEDNPRLKVRRRSKE